MWEEEKVDRRFGGAGYRPIPAFGALNGPLDKNVPVLRHTFSTGFDRLILPRDGLQTWQ